MWRGFPLPFCFYLTPLALTFFPILDVLALTKYRSIIVKQSVRVIGIIEK